MLAGRVDGAVILHHCFDPGRLGAGQHILEQLDKMTAYVAAQIVISDRTGGGFRQNTLDGPANVNCGVNQGAVNVENIDRKAWQQTQTQAG
jgi:hypothetical protein